MIMMSTRWYPVWVLLCWTCLITGSLTAAAAGPSSSSSSSSWNMTCPTDCGCSAGPPKINGPRAVQCIQEKLTAIPQGMPLDVQVLQLKGNALDRAQLSQFTQLREIDLSFNGIDSSSLPVFGNLTSLETLNLEHNNLASLPNGAFSGLTHLQQLVLADNIIVELQPHSFRGLGELKTLSLSGNKLQMLDPVWFEDMKALQTLLLADNLISEIPDGTFDPLSELSRLILADNKLRSLGKMTFKGPRKVQTLDISGNEFVEVPSLSLTAFSKLRMLILDSNPIHMIGKLAVRSIFVQEIHMNDMPELITIDTDAFYDLVDSTVLHIHDNPKLTYIDPAAFHNVPHLDTLCLKNNNLMALPQDLVSSLPALNTVSLYGNPLRCDCNIRWIKELLVNRQNMSTIFQESDKFVCDTPIRLHSKLLKDVSLGEIPQDLACAPTVLAFFNDSYQEELGESVRYECRGIGQPPPHIHWILSNGKVVNNTSNISHIRLDTTGTLSINHLKAIDAGTYTCVATNPNGLSDASTTVLRVHNQNIRIIYQGVATNFVTVTWNGTSSTITTSNYLILYRKSGSDGEFRKVHIRPYMREYTISNLKPETAYEFCIAYQHNIEIVKLDCMHITTKNQASLEDGITSIKKTTVGLAFTAIVMSIVFLCITMVLVRRYRRRKSYKEPSGHDFVPHASSSSQTVNSKVGTMSQIPLDNLYHPPSTPLYTSRTSLIGTSTGTSA